MENRTTYEDILALRAVRSFQSRPVAERDLASVLEAGRWTGSSKNRQNWSFVVVTDSGQRERLATCGDFTTPIRNAPLTLALVQEDEGYEFDTGRLAQNIMLAAAATGLASCPITLHRDAAARDVLGLPDGARCRYAIALGYPGDGVQRSQFGGRKPLAELVHRDRYGG